jgi:hypothetical protein|tara:strand:+ start:1563 stop:2033 length:471 start_codon:yes stop_codon:yes gene_type:complete
MNQFENITVYKNQYVKVQSVKITVPLVFGDEEEEVKFTTNNRELIHLFINRHPIFSNSDYNQCVNKLVKIIIRDIHLSDKQKCMFECWNAFGISLLMGDWIACSKGEADNYKYTQTEKLFEYLNGNKDTTAKNYWRISAEYQLNSPLLKPLFTSIT